MFGFLLQLHICGIVSSYEGASLRSSCLGNVVNVLKGEENTRTNIELYLSTALNGAAPRIPAGPVALRGS